MNTIHLISEITLKKYSLISDNVDSTYIAPAVVKAQDMGLQPLIGTNLLVKIYNLVDTEAITMQTNAWYKTLLDDYIAPYLCQKVMADIQIPLFAKIRNAGITQSQDQQTTQLSIQEVEYIKNKYENDATFYANRMTDYLKANSIHYPEYRTIRDSADMNADDKAFNTHIVL